MLGRLLRFFSFLLPLSITAQQDPQFGQYMMNPFIWNPSYTAITDHASINLHHRTQWLGYNTSYASDQINPPSTQLVTFSLPVSRWKSGFGLSVMNDNIGPVRNLAIHVAYAYQQAIGPGKLAIGLSGGMQSISINTNVWRPENSNDPTLLSINSGTISQLKPNFKLGAIYALQNLYVGLAVNHLYSPAYVFSGGINSQLIKHYYFQSAYKIEVGDRWAIQPSFIYKRINLAGSVEFDNLFLFGKTWLGVGYRTADAAIILAGINLLPDNSLKIGYNIDFSVINSQAKSLTSHEIFMSYNIGSILDNRKPIVRSPRFRY